MHIDKLFVTPEVKGIFSQTWADIYDVLLNLVRIYIIARLLHASLCFFSIGPRLMLPQPPWTVRHNMMFLCLHHSNQTKPNQSKLTCRH